MNSGEPHLTIKGIDVYFQASYLIAAAAAVLFLRELGAILAVLFAGSVLVHEMFHSMAFRRYGSESHIVIRLFGGYSAPHRPHALGHQEWMIVSAAGPLGALVTLGIPALLLRNLDTFAYGHLGYAMNVLVWINVYWGIANLLPIWPLDGGRLLYHGSEGNWELTKFATIVFSAVAGVVLYSIGYPFAMTLAIFNAWRVWTQGAPGRSGLGDDRIRRAVREAKRHAPSKTKTRGEAGHQALNLVYREIARNRHDRIEEPLSRLAKSRLRDEAATAAAWSRLLQGEPVEQTGQPLVDAMATLLATPTTPIDDVARALDASETGLHLGPAIILLHRTQRLGELPITGELLSRLERVALDLGLVDEQIAITALRLAASEAMPSDA